LWWLVLKDRCFVNSSLPAQGPGGSDQMIVFLQARNTIQRILIIPVQVIHQVEMVTRTAMQIQPYGGFEVLIIITQR
jgi:hypothetical protein